MISRCPVCKGNGLLRIRLPLGGPIKIRCWPCGSSGRIEIVTREQAELNGTWLPIEKVAELKAQLRAHAPTAAGNSAATVGQSTPGA